MTIETLAFLTILIIIALALAAYCDYRRDKAAELHEESLAKLEKSANKVKEAFADYNARCRCVLYRINTDELGMQSAAYAEYEDTPPFITEALERRADTELAENEELPDWARRWLEESEDGE